jgi:hypothetical protein
MLHYHYIGLTARNRHRLAERNESARLGGMDVLLVTDCSCGNCARELSEGLHLCPICAALRVVEHRATRFEVHVDVFEGVRGGGKVEAGVR